MAMRFQAITPERPGGGRAAAFFYVSAGGAMQQSRPRGAVLGRESFRPACSFLATLPSGEVLVGFGGVDFPGKECALQVRASDTLALFQEIPGVDPPFLVRPGGAAVLESRSPPPWGPRLLEVPSGRALDTLPVGPPFVWQDQERILAAVPVPWIRRATAPDVAAAHPYVEAAIGPEIDHGLMRLDLGRTRAEVLVGEQGIDRDSIWFGLYRMALGADGRTLFLASWHRVAACDADRSALLWEQVTRAAPQHGQVRDIAPSPDGRHLAVITERQPDAELPDLLVLDAATGEFLHRQALGALPARVGMSSSSRTALRCLAWHPSGWLAVGSAAGFVFHLDTEWNARVYRGSERSVEALTFVEEGRSLLAAGAAPGFRCWELLDDEGVRNA
jgi:hypothetical protein